MHSQIKKRKINVLFGSGVDTIDGVFTGGIDKWLGCKYDFNFVTMSTHKTTELLRLAEEYDINIFILVLNNMLINHMTDTGRDPASGKLGLVKYLKLQYNKPLMILCGYEFEDTHFESKCRLAGADYYSLIPCELELFVYAFEKCLKGYSHVSWTDGIIDSWH